jgi:ribonuclease HII
MVNLEFEHTLRNAGVGLIAGVDEAGRGPLAGPVVAAAVIFAPSYAIEGVDDSKKLSPARRAELFERISAGAIAVGVGIVTPGEIDELNIYRASMRAMEHAVARLVPPPQHLLVDGPRYLDRSIPFTAIVDGDAKCFSIAAASIIAKVTRDRIMTELDARFPLYGFAKHKGYGTPGHLAALRKYGPSPVHRMSFRMPGKEGGAHE